MYKKLAGLSFLSVLIVSSLFMNAKATALSCVAPAKDRESLSRVISDADYIFEGSVVKESSTTEPVAILMQDVTIYTYTIRISRSYKGGASGDFEVINGGLCGIQLGRDKSYLIYGKEESDDKVFMTVDSKPTSSAGEDIALLNEKWYNKVVEKAKVNPVKSWHLAAVTIGLGTLVTLFVLRKKR